MYKIGESFRAPLNENAIYVVTGHEETFQNRTLNLFDVIYPNKRNGGQWSCYDEQVEGFINDGTFIRVESRPRIKLPEDLFNV